MTAYATDSNGDTLLYQINNDLGHYFAINRDTGDIKIAKVIDKEKLPVVSFVLYIVWTFLLKISRIKYYNSNLHIFTNMKVLLRYTFGNFA